MSYGAAATDAQVPAYVVRSKTIRGRETVRSADTCIRLIEVFLSNT